MHSIPRPIATCACRSGKAPLLRIDLRHDRDDHDDIRMKDATELRVFFLECDTNKVGAPQNAMLARAIVSDGARDRHRALQSGSFPT